jgi:hypothetical protein
MAQSGGRPQIAREGLALIQGFLNELYPSYEPWP